MVDSVDKMLDDQEVHLQAAITTAANAKPRGPVPNGKCFNCDEPVGEGVRYCDADCRDDHLRRLNNRKYYK